MYLVGRSTILHLVCVCCIYACMHSSWSSDWIPCIPIYTKQSHIHVLQLCDLMHVWWCPSSLDTKVLQVKQQASVHAQVTNCNVRASIDITSVAHPWHGIIELHYNEIVNIYWARHVWQNQTLDFGLCRKPVHVKWCHTRHESHNMESSESSIMAEVHTPQYHTGCFFMHSTACRSDNHASAQKYFRILPKHTFSSRQDAQIFSGLISTSSSISLPVKAMLDTSGSTNHSSITITKA